MRNLLAAALLAPGAAIAATPDIVACMSANLPHTLRVQAVEVTTWDRAGEERVIKGRLFGSREGERGRFMTQVEHPGDLAGTAFLVREATPVEMYVYLPTVNRVKRIVGSTMNGKLWGTDFSYAEFRRIAGAFTEGAPKLTGETTLEGRAAVVLELAPPAGNAEPYDAIEVIVDRQTCVPLQAKFRQAAVVKKLMTAPAASLRRVGAQWYASEFTLRDLALGTRTQMRVLSVTPGARLSASYFHPHQFYSVR